MARSRFTTFAAETDGDILANKAVTLYNSNGSAFTGTVYDAASGGGVITSFATNSVGVVELYTDDTNAKYIQYAVATATGGNRNGSFDPDPGQVVQLDVQQTLTQKTLTSPTVNGGVLGGAFTGALSLTAPTTSVALVSTSSGVVSVSVTAGGSGYTSGATVSFTGGGGTGAAATATVVANIVTAITVTAAGTGYTSWPTVVVTPVGAGSGATAQANLAYNALTATLPSGSLSHGRAYDGVQQLFLTQGRLIVNHTSLTDSSEVMVNFDFTNRTNASDSGTMTLVCAEGKVLGRSDASFTPSGPAAGLRAIEVRGIWGTWSGLIADSLGNNRHGIGIGLESNTARADGGTGAYAGEQMALYLQHTNNVGQFLDPGSSASINTAINIGGANNATTTQCAFEWPIYVTGIAQTPAIWSVYRTGATGLAKSANPSDGGMLQINQISGDATGSGVRVFRNAQVAHYGEIYMDTTNRLVLDVHQNGIGDGNFLLGSALAGVSMQVTAASGHSGSLYEHYISGTATPRFKIVSTGSVSIQGTQVLGTQKAAVADVAGVIPAGGVGAAAGGFDTAGNRDTFIATVTEMKTQLNALLNRLRASTGHGVIA